MSLLAPVVDGKLQTSTASSDSLAKSSNKSSVDSDTFLTLLVAEMQNQDPLEPTSNTEWVSQYATFTQVEQMTEMGESMDLLRANSMIGKEVVMKVTSESTGQTSYKRGTVDYVTVEDGEALLVIDEERYSISDLDSVASEEYFTAYDLYTEFVGMVDALPSLNLIDKSYENTVGKVYDLYSNLTEYQKNYVDKYAAGYVESYQAYLKKLEQIGITFGEEQIEEEPKATLDDVLEVFNKKMDALMQQIVTMNAAMQQGQGAGNASSGVTNVVDKTEGVNGAGNGAADKVPDGSEVIEGNEAVEGTPSTEDKTESEGSEVTEGTPSTEDKAETEGTEGTPSTEEDTSESDTTQSSGGENEATDEMLDQLTQDTETV